MASTSSVSMKMLFSSADRTEVKEIRKRLGEAGIRCAVRNNPVAQGVFGVPAYPELWIKRESDILEALKLLGPRRLRQMTIVFA